MRLLAVLLLIVAGLTGVRAQEVPWQAVITSQIEAFRAEDAAGALELAGAGFKAQFTDPLAFYRSILDAGYEPILTSRSHSFGEFEAIGDAGVLQVVHLVGSDQALYEALYQMREEAEGWRVYGVALRQEEGVAI